MTVDHDRFAEANQPPPARVTETPEVEGTPELRPAPDVEPKSDDRGADPFGPDYGCDLRQFLPIPESLVVAMVEGAARHIAGEDATLVSVSHRRVGDVLHVTTDWLAKGKVDQVTTHVAFRDGDSTAIVRKLR